MLTATLTLGSESVVIDGSADSYGGRWHVVELVHSAAPMEDTVSYASQHGGYVGYGWLAPRTFALTLAYIDGTSAGRFTARRDLNRVLSLDHTSLSTFTFTDGETVTAQVRRYGEIAIQRLNDAECLLSIGMIAPDPRLYAITDKTYTLSFDTNNSGIVFPVTFPITFPENNSGSVVVTNAGSIDTPFVASIGGPIENPGIKNFETGEYVQWEGSLGAYDILVFDSRAKKATVNGGYQPVALSSRWFDIAPGDTTVTLIGSTTVTPSGSTLTIRDAYDM